MCIRKIYYQLKPVIPRRVQIYLRQKIAFRKRISHKKVWPINEKAGKLPGGWAGWPGQKKFALVLTHDVDTEKGQRNCLNLMDIEIQLGFRSSYNFVPERYKVSNEIRNQLVQNSFEVGVHGLRHDGKLYKSKKIFQKRAEKINHYLKEWDAVGFRSPAMHRKLSWIHDLNLTYDSSTFDIDPFEPHYESVDTIFPFFVSNGSPDNGYVELPYTLSQDHALFVILKEKTIDIWKQKLDWIVKQGGMVLLITHPDYMSFENRKKLEKYPVKYYVEFLKYIKERYEGQYWNVLPKDMARYWLNNKKNYNNSIIKKKYQEDKTIWLDLDNTPHVVLFRPIIEELEKRGFRLALTARDCFQVCGLADLYDIRYRRIGKHYGKNKLLKVLGSLMRAFALLPFVLKNKPDIALSHGSRAQILLSKMLCIPTVLMYDYEYVKGLISISPTWLMAPGLILDKGNGSNNDHVIGYPGIKEDVYVPDFVPDPGILEDLGFSKKDVLVTIRPPATEAHYHNPESEVLFRGIIDYLKQKQNIRMLLLPRNESQGEQIKKMWPEMYENGKLLIPEKVINGLNLIWYSDLVISGGGTMNREAAALGVPVYSIFRGKIGAVDKYLANAGRLTLIEGVDDIHTKIKVIRRDKTNVNSRKNSDTLNFIVNSIVSILENSHLK